MGESEVINALAKEYVKACDRITELQMRISAMAKAFEAVVDSMAQDECCVECKHKILTQLAGGLVIYDKEN